MPEATSSTLTPEPQFEPPRVPHEDLHDLASTLAKTVAEVRRHGIVLDRLTAEPCGERTPPQETTQAPAGDAKSLFIVALGGEKHATELARLANWVSHVLLPIYGREISTTRPWCAQWYEHPEAVARLHALSLAWQQLTDVQAGLTGPSIWHRDHLDHALAQLRSPDGPFAACTTSPARPTHRMLATPAPEQWGPAA